MTTTAAKPCTQPPWPLGLLLYIPQVLGLAQLLLLGAVVVLSLWFSGISINLGGATVTTAVAMALALPLLRTCSPASGCSPPPCRCPGGPENSAPAGKLCAS